MANRKISDLTALTAPATGDLLPIVDISEAAAADKNKKITYGELLSSAPAGSAAAPSFSFDGDPNSGLYSAGADQVAISTAGSGRLFVDASGNVKITSSQYQAIAHKNISASLIPNNAGTDYIGLFSRNSSDSILLGPATSSGKSNGPLTLTSTSVGVGTSVPNSVLHIEAPKGTAQLTIGNTALAASDGDFLAGIDFHIKDNNDATGAVCTSIRSIADQNHTLTAKGTALAFSTTPDDTTTLTERLRIDQAGRVGIGASAPSSLLHLEGSSPDLTIRDSQSFTASDGPLVQFQGRGPNATNYNFGYIRGASSGVNNAGILQLATNSAGTQSVALTIDSSQRVGIGTTSPAALLTTQAAASVAWNTSALFTGGANGDNAGSVVYIRPVANSYGGAIYGGRWSSTNRGIRVVGINQGGQERSYVHVNGEGDTVEFATATAERARIDSSGRLGIGTSTPTDVLHVVGDGGALDNSATSAATSVSNAKIRFQNRSGSSLSEYQGTVNGGDTWYSQIANGSGTALYAQVFNPFGGNVGIGTTSPNTALHVVGAATSTQLLLTDATNATIRMGTPAAGIGILSVNTGQNLVFGHQSSAGSAYTERARIDSSGRVGIGTTSPGSYSSSANDLVVASSGETGITIAAGSSSHSAVYFSDGTTGSETYRGIVGYNHASDGLVFYTAGSLRSTIDSSGRLLVGTSTSVHQNAPVQIVAATTCQEWVAGSNSAGDGIYLFASRSRGTAAARTGVQNGDNLARLVFNGYSAAASDFRNAAEISSWVDGEPDTAGDATDMPGRLVFATTADGASSPTERMRITSAGAVLVGKTSHDINVAGFQVYGLTGQTDVTVSGSECMNVNRNTNDGDLIHFRQDNTSEGSISVSGTTVSYNGAHLSRWSQLPSGADRTEILRGSVLSNIDEMCEWGEEDNEQLNRMKVSDVEGDKNVSGVFQCWDDDDDTYTNDFYCAMTGDFIIRIAEGVTVERGDLLMSAGDGTAKPQDDDIIRSKTIAKVTSINVSCTYNDGSYCVPCVLMAC
jgi:hypothetical protein